MFPRAMNTVSTLSYYLRLLAAYGSYYLSYYTALFQDYPYEVQTAIWFIQWAILAIIVILAVLGRMTRKRRARRKTHERLHEQFDEVLDAIFAPNANPQMTRDELSSHIHLADAQKNPLKTQQDKRGFCHLIYYRLVNDTSNEHRSANIQLLLDMFGIPTFLENEVSLGGMRSKVKAMTMIRTFKLYISPWVINKLLNSKKIRVRRLAMYSAVMSSSDSDLDYFETDFFDENCCIYDEIELGYVLHRRRAAGLKLPNLAHWAHLQKNDSTKCMFVRLMRRFDQREHCHQLEDLFHDSKHKKLIEEISRTWGYCHYTEAEPLLVDTMLTQPDDTKVAIMHAITRLASGNSLHLLLDGYENSTNPHVRFEALRCMYSYGEEGRALLWELEKSASETDRKFYTFFHNPITLDKIPLDKEQAYHPSVETVYNQTYV